MNKKNKKSNECFNSRWKLHIFTYKFGIIGIKYS